MPPKNANLLENVKGCAGILSLLSDRIDDYIMKTAGPNLKVIITLQVAITTSMSLRLRLEALPWAIHGRADRCYGGHSRGFVAGRRAACARGLSKRAQQQMETWEPLGWIGVDLRGKTLGIVGMGAHRSGSGRTFGARMGT